MKKRCVAVLLAAMWLLCLTVSGCQSGAPASQGSGGDSSAQKSAGTADQDAPPAVGDFSEKVNLCWYMCGDLTAYNPDNEVVKILNEKFNVELTTLQVNGMEDEKMNVTLAGGTIPDVFIRWGVNGYYEDGIVQAVDKQLIETYMPESYKIFDSYGEEAWGAFTNAKDDKLMAIPQVNILGDAVMHMAIREDWLQAVGAQVPTTIDELTEVFRKFTFEDPDGNGVDDTYGLTTAGLASNMTTALLEPIFGAFGVQTNMWTLGEEGSATMGCVQEGFREGLKQLNAWYEEGLMDKDWVTTDSGALNSKLQNGVAGVWMPVHPSYMNSLDPTGMIAMTKANNPNAVWKQMAPVKGPDGKSGSYSFSAIGGWGMMFGAKATQAQIIRAMQIAEALNLDEELFALTFCGIEGKTYNREEGSKYCTAIAGAESAGQLAFRTGSYLTEEIYSIFTAPEVLTLTTTAMEFPVYKNVIDINKINADMTDEEKLAIDEAEMTKLYQEFFFNGIIGAIDIDAEWDAYVEKWYSLGGELQTESARSLDIIRTNP